MTPELAKKINVDFTNFVQETLEEYVKERTQKLYGLLENAIDMEEVSHIQGRIKELKELLKAKGYAKDVLNLKDK